MAGGSLSLTGNRGLGEDVLNIKPQITFFKKVYKRHTNFGTESISQPLNSVPNFGTTNEINIIKTGSLITNMHIEFTLPPARGAAGVIADGAPVGLDPAPDGCVDNYKDYAQWVNAVGFAIIDEIQLKFGTSVLDKHTGLWYDILNELTDPNRKEWPLVGKYTLDDFNDLNNTSMGVSNKSRYFVPLKFYFNKDPGLALPIFLLNTNELKILLKLKPLNSLLVFDAQEAVAPVIEPRSIENFKLIVNYVFLEEEEEMKIKNSLPSEYLVETVDIKSNLTTNNVNNLVFENPTKEFIWVFRHSGRLVEGNTTNNIPKKCTPVDTGFDIRPNDIFNYASPTINTSLGMGTLDQFKDLIIKINNQDRFERTDSIFFRTIEPYKHHSNIPGGFSIEESKKYIYVYSFALNPEEYQPSGSYNFSLNNDPVSFEFNNDIDNVSMAALDLTIFAVRYEYLVFNEGSVTISQVPMKTSFKESQEEKKSEGKTSININRGVQNEIKRRYAVEVPYMYDQNLGKKKWSGLQGDFFQKQKMDDLNQKYEEKKKDIF